MEMSVVQSNSHSFCRANRSFLFFLMTSVKKKKISNNNKKSRISAEVPEDKCGI